MLAPFESHNINDGAPWTEADHERLAELYAMSPRPRAEEIASIMGRGIAAIQSRASILNLSAPVTDSRKRQQTKMRKCLGGCDRMIRSDHFGHRICVLCKNDPVYRYMRCA